GGGNRPTQSTAAARRLASRTLAPRTRSSRTSCGNCNRELRVQRGTRIIELLVVLRFRTSYLNVPRVPTNFGIGPLVMPGSLPGIAADRVPYPQRRDIGGDVVNPKDRGAAGGSSQIRRHCSDQRAF